MGKRKRSHKDNKNVENLLKEVKKLVKRRRRISSSSCDEAPPLTPAPTSLSCSAHSPAKDIIIGDLENHDEIPSTEAPVEGEEIVDNNIELDPDILELLGSDPTQDKLFGENLHKDLATRWKYILLNGLPKNEKIELLKQYLPAENCAYMKAPVLNLEIKSALSEINLKKDSYSEQKQNQMSSCLSAIGKALNLALLEFDKIPPNIIKTLSDAGRLLCDTHYRESLSRRFAIVNSISKQRREMIKNTKIDENLFGLNLSEHLKSSKVISQSASELRYNAASIKFNQTHSVQPGTSRQQALNARGAPRPPPPAARAANARDHRDRLAPAARPRTYKYQTQTRRR